MCRFEIGVLDFSCSSSSRVELDLVGVQFELVRPVYSGPSYRGSADGAACGDSSATVDGGHVTVELVLGGAAHIAAILELACLYLVRGGGFVLNCVFGKRIVCEVEISGSVSGSDVVEERLDHSAGNVLSDRYACRA